ncbi:MFS transporter [Alicyclobacillus tolerans]|uniref:MFS transporter n=1 Tax=Alicyclobacillus tolerans TaxID=90970 RepID=UPI001F301B42|nr:MFS transporter [Alicyclobacillus tolerans]MCF8563929.1 MFS transporter [Alicyclobacillus tolerans]
MEKNSTQTLASAQSVDARRWWILANVSVGTFMAVLDGGIANVALPSISSTLHVSISVVEWVVTAYLLTISALLPVVGKVSDMLGKSRVYNVGFLVFAAGSALCGISTSVGMLIAMRVLQAMGASLLMANSQAIVALTFPAKERGRAMGIIGTMVAIGGLAGPAIGGVLIGWFGWPAIFWVNVPIGLIGFLAALKILPRPQRARTVEPFDYLGSVLFMAGIVLFLYTVSNAEAWGFGSLRSIGSFAVSAVLLGAFYLRERWTTHPMLDFSLYRNRLFAMGTSAALLSFAALFCTNIMMPFYMQNLLHFSPQLTGTVMAAYPLTMAVTAPVAGWLSDKIGPFVLTTAGLSLNALGFMSLNLLGAGAGAVVIALHLAVFGIGQGMFQSPNNSSIMGSVQREKLGVAGGINALVRNIGMLLGISLSVSLFSARLHQLTGSASLAAERTAGAQEFVAALHTVFWAAAAVCLLGVLFSLGRSRGRHTTAAAG